MTSRMRPLIVIVAAAAGLGACGGGSSSSNSAPGPVAENPRSASSYTEAQIKRAVRVTDNPPVDSKYSQGTDVDAQTGCTVSVYLITAAMIETYASAGDPVATNPGRTAGVKYGGYEGTDPSTCYHLFTARLRALD